MIGLYTHGTRFYQLEGWRYLISRYIFRKQRGPDAVCESLVRGLKELGVEFALNPKQPQEVTVVLSGTEALRQALAAKFSGQIKKLIVGPNIVIHPYHAERIICDEAIDIVLVPSKWVADFWSHEAPALKSKIRIWPAGVAVSSASTRMGQPIIYDKLGDKDLLAGAEASMGTSVRKFTYGQFSRQKYLKALTDAPVVIYLSRSESQGLALQEAWAHDVPTLVNKSTHWEGVGLSWDSPQINCPYLTPELGAVFENLEELPRMIEKSLLLHPKHYCDKHLSDRASVQALLKLI